MILDCRRPTLTRRTAYSSIPRKLNREMIWIICVVLLLARHARPAQTPAAKTYLQKTLDTTPAGHVKRHTELGSWRHENLDHLAAARKRTRLNSSNKCEYRM